MEKREAIRQLIINEMKAQELTAAELGRRAGVSGRVINYWQRGELTPRFIHEVDKVLKALGLTVTLGA